MWPPEGHRSSDIIKAEKTLGPDKLPPCDTGVSEIQSVSCHPWYSRLFSDAGAF